MKAAHLANLTTSQLTEKFVSLAIAKGQAIMGDENAKASRIYWQIDAIENELRSRDGDQRRVLSAFFQHPDPSPARASGYPERQGFRRKVRIPASAGTRACRV